MPAPASRQILFDMMESAVSKRVFPGGVLAVSVQGEIAHLSVHGVTSVWPPGEPLKETTLFDLASLTKVLATTSSLIRLVEQGVLSLDDFVSDIIPAFSGAGRERITIAHLLAHTSGLAAWRPFFEEVAAANGGALLATRAGLDATRRMLAAEVPYGEPGRHVEYSDLGFMLLDWVIENACDRPGDEMFHDLVAEPLGLENTFFVDLKTPARTRRARRGKTFAATERCPWRGRVISGEVHDDNSYAMGGVSGHAGLFSSAGDVLRIACTWLDSWRGNASLFERSLVKKFWAGPGSDCIRALGFDKPAAEGSQAGNGFGPSTVGHTGFTGTSLWLDPDRFMAVALLTNRVHPSRENDAIKEFRPLIHNKVAEVF